MKLKTAAMFVLGAAIYTTFFILMALSFLVGGSP